MGFKTTIVLCGRVTQSHCHVNPAAESNTGCVCYDDDRVVIIPARRVCNTDNVCTFPDGEVREKRDRPIAPQRARSHATTCET